MLERLRQGRFITLLLTASVLFLSMQPMVNASIVSTEELVAEQQLKIDREYLLKSLQRDEVQSALVKQGVDISMAKERVASMTHEEVRALNGKVDQLPAGSGVVGTVVFVMLVLLVTDIVGWTDVYPFVR